MRKDDFCWEVVSAMVFGGSILGGVCKIWGNPYLNSTTVLFDKNAEIIVDLWSLMYFLTNQYT